MGQFDPLTASILQTPLLQQQQATEKARQLRRAQDLRKGVDDRDDELEHQVENTEEVTPVDDGNPDTQQKDKERKKQGKNAPDNGKPHIDLTA